VARKRNYHWLPVRSGGVIRRIMKASDLENLNSWNELESQGREITVDDLVADDAPMFSALERFEQGKLLLCLGPDGVDGIVTAHDLNRPAAQLFGFALAIVIESEVAREIEAGLPRADEDEAAIRLALEDDPSGRPVLPGRAGKVRRWRKQEQESTNLSFISSLSFGDKLRLVERNGLSRLSLKCSLPADELLGQLYEVKKLRDGVAHDLPALRNHVLVCSRLRTAHRLAHALTGL
jgi:hypothetical protein